MFGLFLMYVGLGVVLILLNRRAIGQALAATVREEKIHGRLKIFGYHVIWLVYIIAIWPAWFGTALFYRVKVSRAKRKIQSGKR